MDFMTTRVTANDHAKSAIIAQMRIMLTQEKHCLPTVKNAFIRGSFQDLDGEEAASRIHWFNEIDGHCRRVVVEDTCVVIDVLCVGDLQCVTDFLVLYL